MMKHLIYLALLISIISCKKEDVQPINNSSVTVKQDTVINNYKVIYHLNKLNSSAYIQKEDSINANSQDSVFHIDNSIVVQHSATIYYKNKLYKQEFSQYNLSDPSIKFDTIQFFKCIKYTVSDTNVIEVHKIK